MSATPGTGLEALQADGSSSNYNPYRFAVSAAAVVGSNATSHTTSSFSWWQTIWLSMKKLLRSTYDQVFVSAFARLYVYGPNVAGFGFWQGKSAEQICAQLTMSNEEFWRRNSQECDQIIARHFGSWVVLLEFVIYCVVVWKVTSTIAQSTYHHGGDLVRRCWRFFPASFCSCCRSRRHSKNRHPPQRITPSLTNSFQQPLMLKRRYRDQEGMGTENTAMAEETMRFKRRKTLIGSKDSSSSGSGGHHKTTVPTATTRIQGKITSQCRKCHDEQEWSSGCDNTSSSDTDDRNCTNQAPEGRRS